MTDRVGIVGSPSTTRTITVDIIEDASGHPLQGELVYLSHPMGEQHLIALGTVTEIKTSNRWHEDANMRGVLKRHGSLPHLSGEGDVRTADVLVQAAFLAEDSDPSVGAAPMESGGALSMSPTTGQMVDRVTDQFLTDLLRRHREDIIYLGRIYRSGVRLPMRIRHFGDESIGGTGEAYHTGVFGRTGSGKSGLAAYLLAAQLRHPELGVLVMDPQGQFTSENQMPFSVQDWAEAQSRPVLSRSISRDLRLPKDARLFGDLLDTTPFFRQLGVSHPTNRGYAAAEFTLLLQGTDAWEDEDSDDLLRQLLTDLLNDPQALQRIYVTRAPRDRLTSTIGTVLSNQTQFRLLRDLFRPIHSLFKDTNLSGGRRHPLWGVLSGLLDPSQTRRPYVIIDFSRQPGGTTADRLLDSADVKARILRRVCSILEQAAEQLYRRDQSLNVSVIFDEAQRFAAHEPEDEESATLADKLVEYVRTTRKYGLGWTFITQEVGSLRRGIYSQLRVKCFGYGLTSGAELQRLREEVPDSSALELYRSFVDPDAISPSEYPFMLTGPVSPLSFTGAPLFLSVFTDFQTFLSENGFEASPEDAPEPE